jgi:hypothetical protein
VGSATNLRAAPTGRRQLPKQDEAYSIRSRASYAGVAAAGAPGPIPTTARANTRDLSAGSRLVVLKDKGPSARCAYARGGKKWESTKYCRKAESELSLPHEQFGASSCQNRIGPVAALLTPGKNATKNFPRLIRHNPLKSLDSDERIQANPS